MLQPMSPINQQITQNNDLDGLQPPWLRHHRFPKRSRDDAVEPTAEHMQQDEDAATPHEVLAQEKRQVGAPVGAN